MNPAILQSEHLALRSVLTATFLQSDAVDTNDPKRQIKAEHLATRTVEHFIRQRRHFTLDFLREKLQTPVQFESELEDMFRSATFEAPFIGKLTSDLGKRCAALVVEKCAAITEDPKELMAAAKRKPPATKKEPTYTKERVQYAVFQFFLHEPALNGGKLANPELDNSHLTDRALLLTDRVMRNLKFEQDPAGQQVVVRGLQDMRDELTKQIKTIMQADPQWPQAPMTTTDGIARGIARHLVSESPRFLMEAKSVRVAAARAVGAQVAELSDRLNAQDNARGAA